MTTYCETDLNTTILELLGIDHGGETKKMSEWDLRSDLLEGFPFSAFESVQKMIEIPQIQLSDILGIPTRTVARRKEAKHLTTDESDRLYRFARIVAFTFEVFGDTKKGLIWLKRQNRGLGGEVPLSLLDTDIGVRQVEDVLQRIKYGIYS